MSFYVLIFTELTADEKMTITRCAFQLKFVFTSNARFSCLFHPLCLYSPQNNGIVFGYLDCFCSLTMYADSLVKMYNIVSYSNNNYYKYGDSVIIVLFNFLCKVYFRKYTFFQLICISNFSIII